MQRAVENLKIAPELVIVDGTHLPAITYPGKAIVKGDLTEPCISAASILAKVSRDREMIQWDATFPGYGFAKHKGYGTEAHLTALDKLGPCILHRRFFGPVAAKIKKQLALF